VSPVLGRRVSCCLPCSAGMLAGCCRGWNVRACMPDVTFRFLPWWGTCFTSYPFHGSTQPATRPPIAGPWPGHVQCACPLYRSSPSSLTHLPCHIFSPQVRFLVMGNVLPSDLRLHRKYDLKGSTYGRTAGPRPTPSGALGRVAVGQSQLGSLDSCSQVSPSAVVRTRAARRWHFAYLTFGHGASSLPRLGQTCPRASSLPCLLQPSARTWTWTAPSGPTPRRAPGEQGGQAGRLAGRQTGRSDVPPPLNSHPTLLLRHGLLAAAACS